MTTGSKHSSTCCAKAWLLYSGPHGWPMVTCFATLVWAPVSPDCCRRFLTSYLLHHSTDSNQGLLNATAGQSGPATLWFQTLAAPHFTLRDGRGLHQFPSPDTTSCSHPLPFPLADSAPVNLQRLQDQLCMMVTFSMIPPWHNSSSSKKQY